MPSMLPSVLVSEASDIGQVYTHWRAGASGGQGGGGNAAVAAGEKVGLGYKRHSSDKRKALTGVQPRPVFARMPFYDNTILPQRGRAVIGYAVKITEVGVAVIAILVSKVAKVSKKGLTNGQHFWADV